jgi:hypothetical protein
MGRVIIVDGIEKGGKSTLILKLQNALEQDGLTPMVRHWGPVKPDDRVYAAPLEYGFGLSDNVVSIWDRSWASEAVYGALLNRQRRGATNPWLLEWLHGRAVQGNGLKIMVLPLDISKNAKLRDDTDLPVTPAAEYEAFYTHAIQFGWNMYWNSYQEYWVDETVNLIMEKFSMIPRRVLSPRYWTHGTRTPRTPEVIIGEARNPRDHETMPGAWLPFTSAKTAAFVQKYFGNRAFEFCWTNADDIARGYIPTSKLNATTGIYTFGEKAANLMKTLHIDVKASFGHPSYFARWNTERGRAALAKFETQYRAVFEI